jgi:hypothetical protein
MKDFYYILGTARNATAAEIEAAYGKLARKFMPEGEHQDPFIDEHFRSIAEAYDVLRDSRRRHKYDAAFRQNQNKQLSKFRLRYLNIAVSVTFLVITALFAAYVIKTIHGHAAKKVVPKILVQPATVLSHPKKPHRAPSPAALYHSSSIDTPKHRRADQNALRPAPTAQPADSAIIHANITGIVYLHEEPDYNSAVLAKIPDAAHIRVLQKGTAYDKVLFNGQEGYVLKSAVEISK